MYCRAVISTLVVLSIGTPVDALAGKITEMIEMLSHEHPPKITKLHVPEHVDVDVPKYSLLSHGERLLSYAYEENAGSAFAAIANADARKRIAAVLATQSIVDIAVFAGREEQFRRVAGQIPMSVQYLSPTGRRLTEAESGSIDPQVRKSARQLVSSASDRVDIAAFTSQAEYEKALSMAVLSIAASGEKAGEKWKFDVQSGDLNFPFKRTVGDLELTSGKINLYELAGNAGQWVFSIPGADAATNTDNQDKKPKPEAIKAEELARRQIVNLLSNQDVADLKSVAPGLFT